MLFDICYWVSGKIRRNFYLISNITNMLEGYDIFPLKGGIHSSVWNKETFLNNIREPGYKSIKIVYKISKLLDIEQSSVLKSDVHIVLHIFWLPFVVQNLKHA